MPRDTISGISEEDSVFTYESWSEIGSVDMEPHKDYEDDVSEYNAPAAKKPNLGYGSCCKSSQNDLNVFQRKSGASHQKENDGQAAAADRKKVTNRKTNSQGGMTRKKHNKHGMCRKGKPLLYTTSTRPSEDLLQQLTSMSEWLESKTR